MRVKCEYCNLPIIKNKEKWLVNENGKFLHYECSVVKNRLKNKGGLQMRFEYLDLLFINVHDKVETDIDVIYKPLGMENEDDEEYFIRLSIQKDSVNMWLEDEHEVDSYLSDEEERYVLREYAMHTVYDVAKQYKEVL